MFAGGARDERLSLADDPAFAGDVAVETLSGAFWRPLPRQAPAGRAGLQQLAGPHGA